MDPAPASDDLESLLLPRLCPAPTGLRERIDQRATGTLRRRRWLRRGRLVVALAACFLAGMVTIDFLHSQPKPVAVGELRAIPQRTLVFVPVEAPRALEL